MFSHKNIARIVGVLYIIGTVSGILSVAFSQPILDETDYLMEVAAKEDNLKIGALCVLMMGLALATVPVMLFPIFKKYDESLALGYVIFRGALEPMTYMVTVISWLVLITFSQEYVDAGAQGDAYAQIPGTLLYQASDWSSYITAIVFGLGALILYYVLFQTNLIPRWLSVWGGIAIVLHIIAGLLAMFAVIELFSTPQMILNIPIFLQEMVMAVWLIVKGFNPSAIATLFPETE